MKIKTISKILILSMILMCLLNSTIYAGEELIKRGDKSEDVLLLQQLLKDRGYFEYDNITGYYGIITENAVKAFQRENNLKDDGITGTATWAALLLEGNEEDETETTPNTDELPLSESDIYYSLGMECANIVLIQSRLNDLGFYNYDNITGYFGSITNKAVIAFQESCQLEPTGVVDEITWNKLFDDYESNSLLPGTVSESVIPLQTKLYELGYYSFEIDGNYGPKTKEAVKYFQKASGLTANGIADVHTQELLYSENAIAEQEARRSITSSKDDSIIMVNSQPKAEDVVEIAKQYLGCPYVYGAQGPDAFDCTGFITYIYDLVGIEIPNSTALNNFDNYGTKINDRSNLKIGDLVFFDTIVTDGNLSDHVGIYIGDGNFIHVDESFGNRAVVIDSITKENGWYSAKFSWGRRIID